MQRTDTSGWPCTIARSVNVLGDHWNLLLIRQACLGTRRFGDFQAALGEDATSFPSGSPAWWTRVC